MTQPTYRPLASTIDPASTGLVPAPVGSRIGAYLLDSLWLGGIPLILFGILYGSAVGSLSSGGYSTFTGLITAAGIVPQLLGLVLGIFYYAGMGTGRSPGMKALKIRLITLNTLGAPGFWTAVGRGIIFSLAGSIVVGYFSPLFDNTGAGRGWHDKASNTWMIDDRITPAKPRAQPQSQAQLQASALASAPVAVTPLAPPPRPAPPLAPPLASAVSDDFNDDPAVETVIAPPRPAHDPAAVPAVIPVSPFAQAPLAPPQASAPRPQTGLISEVPGAASRPPVVPPIAIVPVVLPVVLPATPFPVAPLAVTADDDDLDRTRAVAPTLVVAEWILRLDTGEEFPADGPGYVGRNPAAPATDPDASSARLVVFADDTRSISKTHLGFGLEGSRLWVTDRRSTNGTSVIRAGRGDQAVATDGRTYLEAGDVLALGDRRITVGTR